MAENLIFLTAKSLRHTSIVSGTLTHTQLDIIGVNLRQNNQIKSNILAYIYITIIHNNDNN